MRKMCSKEKDWHILRRFDITWSFVEAVTHERKAYNVCQSQAGANLYATHREAHKIVLIYRPELPDAKTFAHCRKYKDEK